MKLNKYEWLDYNAYAKMSDEQLDEVKTKLFDTCSYYNHCGICPLHKDEYENVNCKMDLISLAMEDSAKIEIE